MASIEQDNSRDATVVFLGTGTSVGVPAIVCDCEVCTSDNPRNKRMRCAIAVETSRGTILVDTPPDLRTQLLREEIRLIHAVIYTHEHVDHLYGLDDLRLFPYRLRAPVPLYCTTTVEARIKRAFDYAFSNVEPTHPGAVPNLEIRNIDPDQPFETLGTQVVPIPMKHGPRFDVLGFRFGNFAYCTDTSFIPDSSVELLEGVETFVVDGLRPKAHPTHFNLDQAVEMAQRVGAKQTYLTHMSHDLEHDKTCSELPDGIDLAYDGLRVPIDLAPGAVGDG